MSNYLTTHLSGGSRESLGCSGEPVVNEITAHQLVQGDLPVSVLARSRKIFDDSVDSGSKLGHLTLYVELERLLAKVCIDHLARSLKADGGVKLGRKIGKGGALSFRSDSRFSELVDRGDQSLGI